LLLEKGGVLTGSLPFDLFEFVDRCLMGLLSVIHADHGFQLAIFERAEITPQGAGFLMQILQFFRIADLTPVESRLGLFNFGTLCSHFLLSHLERFSGFLQSFLQQLNLFLGSSNGGILSEGDLNLLQPRFGSIQLRIDLLKSIKFEGLAHD
jgi:hypothetical protein